MKGFRIRKVLAHHLPCSKQRLLKRRETRRRERIVAKALRLAEEYRERYLAWCQSGFREETRRAASDKFHELLDFLRQYSRNGARQALREALAKMDSLPSSIQYRAMRILSGRRG
jgi:acyl-CoA reductase-like NAD-dependent aldehyde dehydrogenase